MIPAAHWSESDEGSRSLEASSADARAEFEPPADGKSEGFLLVHEHGHHQGVLLSADGARAAVAVLMRWLAESAPAVANHPPAIIEAGLPDGFTKISGDVANYRGWRYLLVNRKWHRTHQLNELPMPSRGPVYVCGGYTIPYASIASPEGYIVWAMANKEVLENGKPIGCPDEETQRINMHLIAAAFNAATAAADLGFDPVAAVQVLPELLVACNNARHLYEHLCLGPLDAAAKYGDDYEPPSDAECLKVIDDLRAALSAARTRRAAP